MIVRKLFGAKSKVVGKPQTKEVIMTIWGGLCSFYWRLFSCYPVIVVNDCGDDNARQRQEARYATLFSGSHITFVPVRSDIEAAIAIIDALDALYGRPGVILINVAPRHGVAKKWPNGTPFGRIDIGKASIIGSVDGFTFSLLQKVIGYKLILELYDIPEVVSYLGVSKELQEQIIRTQFRSFEFLPRIAAFVLVQRKKVPTVPYIGIKDFVDCVTFVDCFGNLKTSILPWKGFHTGQRVELAIKGKSRKITCYERLSDVPDGKLGLVIGSSGLGRKRFLEIMIQGSSAVKELDLESGDKIEVIKVVD